MFQSLLEKKLQDTVLLTELMWRQREIENYLCLEEVLLSYARSDQPDDVFGHAEMPRREQIMRDSITEVAAAIEKLGRPAPWSPDIKAGDEFLDPIFMEYFKKLKLPNLMRKTDYHVLARLVPQEKIDPEIIEKLDAIVAVAKKAKPQE